MFKKREAKGHLRKAKDEDSDADADNVHDDTVEDIIGNVKARQLQRKKVKYDFSEIPTIDSSKTKAHKQSEASKSIQAMMGSQFAIKLEDSNKFNAHEKIMEKYINEKLGLVEYVSYDSFLTFTYILVHISFCPAFSSSTTGTDMKDVGTATNATTSDDNEIGLLGIGSGLAEVELPMKFKLANIQETEAARQKLIDSRAAKATSGNSAKGDTSAHSSSIGLKSNSGGGDLASFRYQKAYATAFIPAGFGRSNDHNRNKDGLMGMTSGGRHSSSSEVNEPSISTSSAPTVALPSSGDRGVGGGGNSKSEYHPKSVGTRSDDFMVQQFKKVRILLLLS